MKASRSICVKVMGGLGNQLFQYAFGLALSRHFNKELWLDISWFDELSAHTGYELEAFHPAERTLDKSDKKYLKRAAQLYKLGNIFSGSHPSIVKRVDAEQGFEEGVFKRESFRYEGYWQSWKYFERFKSDVMQIYSGFLESRAKPRIAIENLCGSNAVVMHIRRGDYFQTPEAAAVHGVSLEDYYRSAIDRIAVDGMENWRFFIFSDDSDPLSYFPTIELDDVSYCSSALDDPYTDMYLMSKASNLIIANSSYSWWAAWLAGSNANIYCPEKWFKDRSVKSEDLFPDSWQVISS